MAASNEHKHTYTNRLINQTSPYLLQHAHNPVDWYPWCKEAFELAVKDNKPVFLSIGYSACHWCHVMEHESFERDDVAEILNKHFVSVKVDREQRPDIDDVYMTATSLLTGRGGWPNSLWLTPDKKPFYAGTYFPREDNQGMPGFKTILTRLADIWANNSGQAIEQAKRVTEAVKQVSQAAYVETSGQLNDEVIEAAMINISGAFDKMYGGLGSSPKFPPHQVLTLLLHRYRKTGEPNLLSLAAHTADAMAAGGIYDHIGGGFHRYSTDNRWLVPHFEKMLCDNAQLAKIYADMYLITKNENYRRITQETLDWVLREMTDANGGFYSALDADSEGVEGKFYLWEYGQIEEILGTERAKEFAAVYGFDAGGNYRDEATGQKTGFNIVHLKHLPQKPDDRLSETRKILLDARNKRTRPHRDEKILVNCNGLMIASLAYCGRQLNIPKYTEAAVKAADYIISLMLPGSRLVHSICRGRAESEAYLDDHAFLADALLELYDATGNSGCLNKAKDLIETIFEHYIDDRGVFFNTSDDGEQLIARMIDPSDKAMPSGNGAATIVLVKLARITGQKNYLEHANRLLNSLLGFMEQTPSQTAALLTAADMIQKDMQ